MSLQIIIRAADVNLLRANLGDICDKIELFPIGSDQYGISIPSKVITTFGENTILEKIAVLHYYDLWAGVWKTPLSHEKSGPS
jgi:hypothetical protein